MEDPRAPVCTLESGQVPYSATPWSTYASPSLRSYLGYRLHWRDHIQRTPCKLVDGSYANDCVIPFQHINALVVLISGHASKTSFIFQAAAVFPFVLGQPRRLLRLCHQASSLSDHKTGCRKVTKAATASLDDLK